MSAAKVFAAKTPVPTPLWMWIAWLALSVLAWGGIAAVVILAPMWKLAQVGSFLKRVATAARGMIRSPPHSPAQIRSATFDTSSKTGSSEPSMIA